MNEVQVFNNNGVAVVSSRVVAKDFNKLHKNVLRDIDNAIKMGGLNFETTKYFISSTYPDEQNKPQREFLLTRDGFSLIVLGFTGSQAFQWKLKYIDAFNAMEDFIKNNPITPNTAVQSWMEMSPEDQAIAFFTARKENKEQQVLIEQQQKQLDDQQEDVNFSKAVNRTVDSDMLISDFGYITGYGPKRIFTFLKDAKHKYIYDRGNKKEGRNIPLQKYNNKFFIRVEEPVTLKNGTEILNYTTKITYEGQKYLINKHPELVVNRDVLERYKDKDEK